MGLDNLPGWSYSAERAWYDPPEYDDVPEEETEMTVKQLLEVMKRNAENIHNDRPERGKTPRVAETSNVGDRRQRCGGSDASRGAV